MSSANHSKPLNISISELSNQVQVLTREGRFRTAINEIFSALASEPDNQRILSLASIVIDLAYSSKNRTYDSLEPLTEDLLNDTRLDKLFCECENCRATWMPNSLFTMLGVGKGATVYDAPGGICPNCHKVFCHNCAIPLEHLLDRGIATYKCPQCRRDLEPITQPNGRSRRQLSRRKEPIQYVVVLREGPIPPDTDTLTEMFNRISPDIVEDKPIIVGLPVFPWTDDEDVLWKIIIGQCMSWEIFPLEDSLENFYITSAQGENFFIVKIYHPRKLETADHLSYANYFPNQNSYDIELASFELMIDLSPADIKLLGRAIEYAVSQCGLDASNLGFGNNFAYSVVSYDLKESAYVTCDEQNTGEYKFQAKITMSGQKVDQFYSGLRQYVLLVVDNIKKDGGGNLFR